MHDEANARSIDLLHSFDVRLQLIRDRVRGIVDGSINGMYISGPAGVGKTHTVLEVIRKHELKPVLQNGYITPAALFDLLDEYPSGHIVLDDVAALFTNLQALQLLLSATDTGGARIVRYRTRKGLEKVRFTGSITAISNLPLKKDPVALALRSRLVVIEHNPPDDEVFAFLGMLAQRDHQILSPAERTQVVDFLIAECRSRGIRPNLRMLNRGFLDFVQASSGKSVTTWEELIRTSLHEGVAADSRPLRDSEKKEQYQRLMRTLLDKYPNDRERQIADWPKSKAHFYEVLGVVEAQETAVLHAKKKLKPLPVQKSSIPELD